MDQALSAARRLRANLSVRQFDGKLARMRNVTWLENSK
jgi:hypothetical protein